MTHENITLAFLCVALWLLLTWGLHTWAVMPA